MRRRATNAAGKSISSLVEQQREFVQPVVVQQTVTSSLDYIGFHWISLNLKNVFRYWRVPKIWQRNQSESFGEWIFIKPPNDWRMKSSEWNPTNGIQPGLMRSVMLRCKALDGSMMAVVDDGSEWRLSFVQTRCSPWANASDLTLNWRNWIERDWIGGELNQKTKSEDWIRGLNRRTEFSRWISEELAMQRPLDGV